MSARFALTALLLLASCARSNPGVSFPQSGEGSQGAPATGEEFFDFAAPRLGGSGQVTGAELQGKDVALWFWAPW